MKSKEKPDDILRNYKYYLKLEKSLSLNTVNAYLTDLNKLVSFLSEENVHILDVTLEHLETFSAGLRDLGICPKSQARILSGIRSFFHFLIFLTPITYFKILPPTNFRKDFIKILV